MPNLVSHLDDVLDEHRNHVFIDLSWVVYPDYVLEDLAAWSTLIRRYPENFVIGSDAVGRFGDYTDQIRIYGALFDALGDVDLIEGLATANFLRIMRREGVILDSSYRYPETRYTLQPIAPR